jgi:hypothetical protein
MRHISSGRGPTARNLEVLILPPGADKSLSRLLQFEKEPTDCYINKAYAIEDSDCNGKEREKSAPAPQGAEL